MPPQRFLQYVAALVIALGPVALAQPTLAAGVVPVSPHASVTAGTEAAAIHGAMPSEPRAAGFGSSIRAGATSLRREVFGFALASSLSDPTVGYPSWDFSLLSTAAFFGLHINWNGKIVTDSGWSAWNSSSLTGLMTAAHSHSAKVVLTIILQDFNSGTPSMCAGLVNRAITVSQTVAQVAAKGADGVNVDYEGLNGTCPNGQSARSMMTDFLRQLRKALPSSAYLSVDTYASSAADPVGFYDVPGLNPYVDSFFVMAYDLEYSNWWRPPLGCNRVCLGPTAPLAGYYYNDQLTSAQYIQRVPASKVILGVPYYGRVACVAGAVPNAYPTGPVTAASYLSASDERSSLEVMAGSYVTHRDAHDSTGRERWDTWYNTSLGCTRELYFDDTVSLGSKYDLVNKDGLRGIGIWNLNYGGGAPELWSTLKAHFSGCSAVDVSATPATSAVISTVVAVTATATCPDPSPLYEFWIRAPSASVYKLAQAYSSNPVLNWDTAGLAKGTYRINVWVRDASSPGVFVSSSGTWDAYNANLLYTLVSRPCTAVTEAASPAVAATIGIPVKVTASASGCPNPLYEFWVLAPGASLYKLAQAYSTSPVFNWSTTGLAKGTYRINVWVRDSMSSGIFGNSSGRWDAYNANLLYRLSSGCPAVSDAASPPSTAPAGTPVSVTAGAPGCPNPRYEFWVLAPGASLYKLAQAYSANPVLSWKTTGLATGTYRINVWVRDAASSGTFGNSWGRWDAYNANLLFQLTPSCTSVVDSATPAATAKAGTLVKITGSAAGCPNPVYEFWVRAPGAALSTLVQGYGTSRVFTWNTTGLTPGTYRITVWVRDASSSGVSGNSYGRWDAYNVSLLFNLT